jgi:hypothetical protein
MTIDLSNLIGKTITQVEQSDSHSFSMVNITLTFSDGSTMYITGKGCDEGGWLDVDGSAVE